MKVTYNDGVLTAAEINLDDSSASAAYGVYFYPALEYNTLESTSTIASSVDFETAVKFDEMVHWRLFNEGSNPILPSVAKDDPSSFIPLYKFSKNALRIIRLTCKSKKHEIHIGRDDIFFDNVEAIVLATKKNLKCHDEGFDLLINKLADDEYFMVRKSYLKTNFALAEGQAACFPAGAMIKPKWIIHGSLKEKPGLSDLYETYYNCLLKANEHRFDKISFSVFAIGKIILFFTFPGTFFRFLETKLKVSAEAASYAVVDALFKTALVPTEIKFVYYEPDPIQRFGKIVAEMCTKYTKSPTWWKFDPIESSESNEDEDKEKMDKAMALPVKSTTTKAADAAAAQWLETIDVPHRITRKSIRKSRVYGKRSEQEKRKRKARTAGNVF